LAYFTNFYGSWKNAFQGFSGHNFCDTSSRAMNQEGKLIYGGLLLHEPLLPGYVQWLLPRKFWDVNNRTGPETMQTMKIKHD
jgi:hypothetical protein